VTRTPPLVVLVLGGAAERWACPPEASPLSLARLPNLTRLADEGRVFGVRLIRDEGAAHGVAPLLALLGFDPAHAETARAAYVGALAEEPLAAEECFASADFVALFRDAVADVEPGPFRPPETEVLLRTADAAVRRAGFRLVAGAGSHHLAIAPRASVDATAPPPAYLLGQPLARFEPRVAQHAFAQRLARDVLDGHEINEVRRDLGRNGADAIWIWGPGGRPLLNPHWDAPVSAIGADIVWRGLCQAAAIPLRLPQARTPGGLARGVSQALKTDAICFVYAHRGTRHALMRDRRLRVSGLVDIDEQIVGPLAKAVGAAKGRLLILSDTARDSATGLPSADPVPVLLWGEGVRALAHRPFTEAGAAAAGDPLEPGHGLLAYIRHL
jgi:2,3-bisphosphoglycerate-independent phosphoglycerate mutase